MLFNNYDRGKIGKFFELNLIISRPYPTKLRNGGAKIVSASSMRGL